MSTASECVNRSLGLVHRNHHGDRVRPSPCLSGPVYTKCQHQYRVNAAMTLAILVLLKTVELNHSGVILFASIVSNETNIAFVIAALTLLDTDTWHKRGLTFHCINGDQHSHQQTGIRRQARRRYAQTIVY